MPFQFRKEAIEEDLNTNFPSQGQGNPPLYYSLSEVVVPTYSINSSAEGSGLPENLQTAWDFSTAAYQVTNTTSTIADTPGFWLVDLTVAADVDRTPQVLRGRIFIDDGSTTKTMWALSTAAAGSTTDVPSAFQSGRFVVYLRSGDELKAFAGSDTCVIDVWLRQIATATGTLVNPLGFSFA